MFPPLLQSGLAAPPITSLGNEEVLEVRTDFTGKRKWRTHERIYLRWKYENNDGSPNLIMPLFSLEGTMKCSSHPVQTLNLTPYLSWQPGSYLTLDIPKGPMEMFAAGPHDYEICVQSSPTDQRVAISGIIELARSVHL